VARRGKEGRARAGTKVFRRFIQSGAGQWRYRKGGIDPGGFMKPAFDLEAFCSSPSGRSPGLWISLLAAPSHSGFPGIVAKCGFCPHSRLRASAGLSPDFPFHPSCRLGTPRGTRRSRAVIIPALGRKVKGGSGRRFCPGDQRTLAKLRFGVIMERY
jgi:hypothetical protein